jgi:soluble cytochrome b562
MHRMYVSAVITTVLAAGVLFAQSDNDYQSWMKTVAASNQSLQKKIAAKDGAGAAADAQKLEDTFKLVEEFWQKRNAVDAVHFAEQAQTAAASISKSAAAGNIDQASAEVKNLMTNCSGCHSAHREKTEGGFKIK